MSTAESRYQTLKNVKLHSCARDWTSERLKHVSHLPLHRRDFLSIHPSGGKAKVFSNLWPKPTLDDVNMHMLAVIKPVCQPYAMYSVG